MGNLLRATAQVVNMVLNIYMWIVIIAALISWVNPDPYNPIVRFLHRATEPVFQRVRRFIPPMGGIDLSPLVVLLAIYFLQYFLVTTLLQLSMRMG